MTERWLPIVGFEDTYEISDLGMVRRIGKRQGARVGRIMSNWVNSNGYLSVQLSKNGKGRATPVHIAVARTFLGPPPPGHEVNHKDADRTNPRLTNLEYVTHLENMQHCISLGRFRPSRGESNGFSKLTETEIQEIRTFKDRWPSWAVAMRFGIHKTTVNRIYSRFAWPHVG